MSPQPYCCCHSKTHPKDESWWKKLCFIASNTSNPSHHPSPSRILRRKMPCFCGQLRMWQWFWHGWRFGRFLLLQPIGIVAQLHNQLFLINACTKMCRILVCNIVFLANMTQTKRIINISCRKLSHIFGKTNREIRFSTWKYQAVLRSFCLSKTPKRVICLSNLVFQVTYSSI